MFMFVLYIKYGCALRALEAERHIVMHLMFVWVCYQIIVAAAGPWSKVGGQRRHYLFWGTRPCVVALRWRIQCFCLDGRYGRICCIMMQQSLSLRWLKSCVDTRNLERTKQLCTGRARAGWPYLWPRWWTSTEDWDTGSGFSFGVKLKHERNLRFFSILAMYGNMISPKGPKVTNTRESRRSIKNGMTQAHVTCKW